MLSTKKLPTIEPGMRDALRRHVIKKRQRLKQEQEQDAIEKRIKREKEAKEIQDAMTLDQIKQHLFELEKKLETLKIEKSHLFVQLKQLLNEQSFRRQQVNNCVENPARNVGDDQERNRLINDPQEQTDQSLGLVGRNKQSRQLEHHKRKSDRTSTNYNSLSDRIPPKHSSYRYHSNEKPLLTPPHIVMNTPYSSAYGISSFALGQGPIDKAGSLNANSFGIDTEQNKLQYRYGKSQPPFTSHDNQTLLNSHQLSTSGMKRVIDGDTHYGNSSFRNKRHSINPVSRAYNPMIFDLPTNRTALNQFNHQPTIAGTSHQLGVDLVAPPDLIVPSGFNPYIPQQSNLDYLNPTRSNLLLSGLGHLYSPNSQPLLLQASSHKSDVDNRNINLTYPQVIQQYDFVQSRKRDETGNQNRYHERQSDDAHSHRRRHNDKSRYHNNK